VDAVTLARYANAVFEVCQRLLEEEGTLPQLVAPLLEVVMQVSTSQPAATVSMYACCLLAMPLGNVNVEVACLVRVLTQQVPQQSLTFGLIAA